LEEKIKGKFHVEPNFLVGGPFQTVVQGGEAQVESMNLALRRQRSEFMSAKVAGICSPGSQRGGCWKG